MLSYNKATRKFENLAIDDPQSPYYEIRNEKGKAIGVAGKKLLTILNQISKFLGDE